MSEPRQVITYTDPVDHQEVEVLHGGTWCFGLLRQWTQDATGEWYGNVTYTVAPGETYLDNVPADRLRRFEPPVGGSD